MVPGHIHNGLPSTSTTEREFIFAAPHSTPKHLLTHNKFRNTMDNPQTIPNVQIFDCCGTANTQRATEQCSGVPSTPTHNNLAVKAGHKATSGRLSHPNNEPKKCNNVEWAPVRLGRFGRARTWHQFAGRTGGGGGFCSTLASLTS